MRTRKPLNPMEVDHFGDSWTFVIKISPGIAWDTSFLAVFYLFWAVEGVRHKVGQLGPGNLRTKLSLTFWESFGLLGLK